MSVDVLNLSKKSKGLPIMYALLTPYVNKSYQMLQLLYTIALINLEMWCGKPVHNRHFEILTERRVGSVWIEWIMYVTVMKGRFIYACVAENADNNLEV